MRKKTTWAATVVRKQLQTCCQHETLSLETGEGDDDFSESFEVPSDVYVTTPVKERAIPCLLRRKSFNVSHVRNLLTTPESQSPHRKSVESALPLCVGSKFKPRRLQYVKGTPTLVAPVVAIPMPLPVPPRLEAPKAKMHHKSGPLPMMIWNAAIEGSDTEMNTASPVKVKKYFSGPLIPSLRRLPSSDSPSSTAAAAVAKMQVNGKKPMLMGGGPSPTTRFTKPKQSLQSLFPTIATSKPDPEGKLKKGAQLAKVTPVLDKKGSRSFRPSRGDSNPTAPSSVEVKSRGSKAMMKLAKAAHAIGVASPSTRDGGGGLRKSRSSSEKERVSAAVRIQAAIRGYRARKAYAIELARANNVSGELTDEEVEEAPSISTRMSRTNPRIRNNALNVRVGTEQVSKSWNGSLRTAQDCQAILKSKQEAALKRERALEYAMSRQNWKTGSKSQKAGPAWVLDDTFPDKPSWVWNWLERAARMGAHNSVNRIYDSGCDNNEPVSESISVKSTVGVTTTDMEDGSNDADLVVPMTYPWPLSLRQQHAAGLLKKTTKAPARLTRPSPHVTSEVTQLRESPLKRTGPVQRAKPGHQREGHSSPADSCVTSQMSEERLSPSNPRKLDFTEDVAPVKQSNDGGESVGSCPGPLPSLYRLYSPFTGPKTKSQSGLQPKMSKSNSLKVKANPQGYSSAQKLVPTAISESDSDGTTAASVRRPFWRP